MLRSAFLLIVIVSAAATNPCLDDWQQASADNKIECDSVTRWVDYLIPKLYLPAALLAAAILSFCACPWVFCFRYLCQCCGGSRQRPDGFCCGNKSWDDKGEDERFEAYSPRCVTYTKVATLVVSFIAVMAVGIAYGGTIEFGKAADAATNGVSTNINWLRAVIADVMSGTRRPDQSYPFDISPIQDVDRKLVDADESVRDRVDSPKASMEQVVQAVGYATILPGVAVLISVLPAMCNIRTCVPALLICLYFLLAFVYLFSSSLVFIVNIPVNVLCDEVDLQFSRQKGILQWYAVPKCESVGPMKEAKKTLSNAESDLAHQACNSLQAYCSSSESYDSSYSAIAFFCNMSAPGNCSDFAGINEIANSARLKAGHPETCGGNVPCTLDKCAQYCNDTTLRGHAQTFVDRLADANRVVSTFRRVVLPLLDCNTLIDQIIRNVPVCDHLPNAFGMLGAGFALEGVTLLCGIVVLFLGQKRFFNPDKYRDEGGPRIALLRTPLCPHDQSAVELRQAPINPMALAPPPDEREHTPINSTTLPAPATQPAPATLPCPPAQPPVPLYPMASPALSAPPLPVLGVVEVGIPEKDDVSPI